MNMMTDGKWRLSFEVAAQNQMKHQVSFAPEIQRSFVGRERHADEHDEVVLGAADEVERLVEDRHRRDQEDDPGREAPA